MRFSRLCTPFAAMLLTFCCAFAPAAHAKIDFTDIWYADGGIEGGWGVNFAQTGDFIFATFFIYGPDGAPVWYTAQLSRTAGDSFSGPMYVVTGTWFGAPTFPPVPPQNVVLVGDATFTASSGFRGTLRYRIDTVTVTKAVERQTTTPVLVADLYLGGMVRTMSGNCPAGMPSAFLNTVQLQVFQSDANTLRLEFYGADSTNIDLFCVMQGNAAQHGKILHVPGAAYQCGSNFSTTAVIESIRLHDDGIEAHWHASLGGTCVEQGRLAGVKQ